MQIVNENYILIWMEFSEENKESIDTFRVSLLEDKKYYDMIENNRRIQKSSKKKRKVPHINEPFYIPRRINNEFIEKVKVKRELNKETFYLYPIDFSIIKRVSRMSYKRKVYKDGKPVDVRRRLDKIAGIVTLYKYMGPAILINDFLHVLKNKFEKWHSNKENILSKIKKFKIILCSEIHYSSELSDQNYFIVHLEFKDKNANPNDFREYLLGIPRDEHKKIDYLVGFLKKITENFIGGIKEKYLERILDDKIKYAFPIDFSIIKRPIHLYTEDDGFEKYSDKALGVNLIYKYRGPHSLLNDFKTIFEKTLEELRSEDSGLKIMKKVNKPLLLVGAPLKKYKIY